MAAAGPPGDAARPRYPTGVRRRLTITAGGNLLLALVWLGLWIWKPANWWNLALAVVFAVVAVAILADIRRHSRTP